LAQPRGTGAHVGGQSFRPGIQARAVIAESYETLARRAEQSEKSE
jgi:hypothetical protein